MSTEDRIRKQLQDHSIILYMKGIPDAPECGFSAKAVSVLKATGVPFTYVNVMGSPFIREKLPKVSKWPTFPQLFINGELIGGSDIIEAMAEQGTLLTALQSAASDPHNETQNGTVTQAEVERLIKRDFADAEIHTEGEGCALEITVISGKFAGLSMLKQQQGVMASLAEPLSSGRLHAVTVRSFTPQQWQEKLASTEAANGLLQIQI